MSDSLGDVVQTPDPGTAVLIAGPPMTGKHELLYELLAADDGPGRGTTIVTTRKPGDTVRRTYRTVDPDLLEERLFVIDCVSRQFGDRTRHTDRTGSSLTRATSRRSGSGT